MIIVRPMGGMGNQMYAFALGMALSLRRNQPLVIDKSWIRADGKRRGLDRDALQHFDHGSPEWAISHSPFTRPFLAGIMDKVLFDHSDKLPQKKRWLLVEKSCSFDPWILDIDTKDIYLRGGTWQSFKYFQGYEDEIRRSFSFRQSVVQANEDWVARINEVDQSVFVHIRRGDYVANPSAAYTQGICTAHYYQQAMDYFRQQLNNPVFYFFSDDIAWVRQTFGEQDDYVFVERRASLATEFGYRDDGHNDMYCMSLCRHGIIANSTFSWWAAWLNANPSKIVVAPGKWYQGVEDDSFIVKPEWVRFNG